MMHYKKKRKSTTNMLLDKLHSIPISRSYEEHYKLSHVSNCSIPLVCMVALLLLGVVSVNPTLFEVSRSYAVEVGGESVEEITEVKEDVEEVNENDIQLLAANNEPSIGITISNSTQTIETTQGGDTVYGNYGVTLTGKSINSYTLSIAGDTNLKSPSGNTTTVKGVSGNVLGKNITTNTWGYTWTDTNTADTNRPNLTYKALTSSDTQLEKQTYTENQDVTLTKKLIFAGKFGDVEPGTYTGAVKLSAIATAIVTTAQWSNGVDSGVSDMQDVNSSWANSYCGNASGSGANAVSSKGIKVGNTLILKDNRTTGYGAGTMTGSNGTAHNLNEYVIVKLEDGHCWMQENLRLKAPEGGMDLTSADSDVSSWHMPETLNGDSATNQVTGWMNDYNKPYSAYFGNTTNGVYYNWTAAIAMADSSSKTSGDVDTSLCPKGWKLPTSTEYDNMPASSTKLIESSPYYFVAAGLVVDDELSYEGGRGAYWSRTVYSDEAADYISFFSSRVDVSDYTRGSGFSVRCVASV